MNIYKWLEIYEAEYKNETILEELFGKYILGLHLSYNMEMTKNVTDFVNKIQKNNQKKSTSLFDSWFKNIGYVEMVNSLKEFKVLNSMQKSKVDLNIQNINSYLTEENDISCRGTIINSLTNFESDLKRYKKIIT